MKQSKGFSLIELIMVITITGFIIAGVNVALTNTVYQYQQGIAISKLSTKANLAMAILLKDIGNATTIQTLNNSQIKFDNSDEDSVTYQYQSNQQSIRRNQDGYSNKDFMLNLTAFSLSYTDKNLATTNQKNDVRVVTITMTLTEDGLNYSLIGNTEIKANL